MEQAQEVVLLVDSGKFGQQALARLGDLSEVDLSDPEDVKVTANNNGGAVMIHLGAEDFLPRYKLYVTHIAEWKQQFQNLHSIDLRYDGQIIVNPDANQAAPPEAKPADQDTVLGANAELIANQKNLIEEQTRLIQSQARLIDEMHLAVAPILLGAGEHLLAGIDLSALGYTCTKWVASAKATHYTIAKS